MIELLKRDPLAAAMALIAMLVLLAASYFAYTNYVLFSAESEAYDTGSAALTRLRDARPFPDAKNLERVSAELEETKKILEQLSSVVQAQSPPLDKSLTPEKFQDALNAKVNELAELAAAKETALPEDFYLGFGEYWTQPPSPEAAPFLGQQLEIISHIASLVVAAGATELLGVKRQQLPIEGATPATDGIESEQREPALTMSPFDIAFVSDHSSFQNAFAAIVTSNPMVLVRLLSVVNSQPLSPPKAGVPIDAAPAENPSTEESIPVVFGREKLTVKMRLASVSMKPVAE